MRIGIVMSPITKLTPAPPPGAQNSSAPAFFFDGLILPSESGHLKIYNNRFFGLDAAGLIYGNLASVRLEGNTVEQCYVGFWFFSFRSLAFMNDIFSKSGQITNRYSPLPIDPVMALGAGFARGYPLPPAFDATKAGAISVKNIFFTPKGPNSNIEIIRQGFIMNSLMAAAEQPAVAQVKRPFPLAMLATGNQIDAIEVLDQNNPAPVGVRLLVWNDDQDVFGSVTINSNQIRNQTQKHPLPTVGVLLATRCTVTGNMIMNELDGSDKVSLSIIPFPSITDQEGQIAVTGNVFRGSVDVPPHRQAPAPMDNWRFFNSISN
jgi:hypothetical protein